MRAPRDLLTQSRVQPGLVGHALTSGFLLVTLTCLVALNLPRSHLRQTLDKVATPYSKAFGVDQSWSVFAPDPRTSIVAPSARITFADGSTALWSGVVAGNAGVDEYVTSRWQKWGEWLTQERYAVLWRPAAEWIASSYASAGRRPVRVQLMRTIFKLPPPGGMAGGAEVEVYYTLNLRSTA